MAQACQVLKPNGVFLASMLGGNTLRELRVALQLAEQEREVRTSIRDSDLSFSFVRSLP